MVDKVMYIPNDNTQNYPFCGLQIVAETFGHSTKWTKQSKFKVVKPTNKKNVIVKLWGLV